MTALHAPSAPGAPLDHRESSQPGGHVPRPDRWLHLEYLAGTRHEDDVYRKLHEPGMDRRAGRQDEGLAGSKPRASKQPLVSRPPIERRNQVLGDQRARRFIHEAPGQGRRTQHLAKEVLAQPAVPPVSDGGRAKDDAKRARGSPRMSIALSGRFPRKRPASAR
jgi:hypothetical protein